jgi:hypothetical protein
LTRRSGAASAGSSRRPGRGGYDGVYSPGCMRVATATRFQALITTIAQISAASSCSPNCALAAS